MQTGVAVLGAGRWGVHLVRNFAEHPQSKLVAVLDPTPDRLHALTQRLNLEGVALVTSWKELVACPGVEAVVIVTPAITHYELVKSALKQGYHVLAEKPLTLDPNESLELCKLAEQQQRQLVVDHTYLFHPAVQRGSEVVRSGQLGELRYGYAARTHLGPVRQDVDVMWDLVIHDIAILNFWLGEMPQQVAAQGKVWLQPKVGLSEWFPHGLADQVWVTVIYPSGFQAQIHLCWLNPDKQRRLCVVGSQGTLIFDELTPTPLTLQHGQLERRDRAGNLIALDSPEQPATFVPTKQRLELVVLDPVEPLRQVCGHFLDCVRENRPSPVSSGWVGADLVKVLAALSRSLSQNGQPQAV
ncbi:MAG: Gfo/Idh/MocA family oxidoreductase [Leptolyngbyaceae cyanobacterium bins.59]|nr:Gfo/Idh/MocA family oxidoreductase [Leptolyngbyaceae cyanobacterium bins.59]